MHDAIIRRLEWFVEKCLLAFETHEEIRVLDIGVYDRDPVRENLLKHRKFSYFRLEDLLSAGNESLIRDPYHWPEMGNDSIDVVISTHALEHVDFPWLVFDEIRRVLRPGGVACITEPAIGFMYDYYNYGSFAVHRSLPDYYRFGPGALAALAERSGLVVIHSSNNKAPLDCLHDMAWREMGESMLVAEKRPPSGKAQTERGERNRSAFSDKEFVHNNAHLADYDLKPKRRRKLLCMGVCNAATAFHYLRLAAVDHEVDFCDPRRVRFDDNFHARLEAYEAIFLYPPCTREQLRGYRGKIIPMANIVFGAFHPDFVKLGASSVVTGSLHSRIAAECFLRGYSEEKTLSMFEHGVYARLGYFNAWEAEKIRLEGDFALAGLRVDDFLPRWAAAGPFMFDPGHPKDFAVKMLVDSQCEKFDIRIAQHFTPFNLLSRLADIFPIYTEIAEYLGYPNAGSYRFVVRVPYWPPYRWAASAYLQ